MVTSFFCAKCKQLGDGGRAGYVIQSSAFFHWSKDVGVICEVCYVRALNIGTFKTWHLERSHKVETVARGEQRGIGENAKHVQDDVVV